MIVCDAALERGGTPVLDVYRFDASRFRVNHILAPDTTPLHNHPWQFCWGLIVNGGYTHEFATLGPDGQLSEVREKTFKPGDVNFMPHALFHRIKAVEPDTYTLFFWGPDVSRAVLSYYVPGRGVVPATEYHLLNP